MVTHIPDLNEQQRQIKTRYPISPDTGANWEVTLGSLLVIGLPLLIVASLYYTSAA